MADTTEADFENEGGAPGKRERSEPSNGSVRLRLAGPMHSTSFTAETPKGDTLTVDREGLDVSASDAEHLTHLAARQGLTLTTKDD